MAQETDTPIETARAATQENALPEGQLVLIGTFLKQTGNEALIRTSSGDVQRVEPGDTTAGGTVTAIEPGLVVLARGGNARKLTLPGG